MRIGEYLILEKVITQDNLDKALEKQKNSKTQRLGAILVNMGAISEDTLNEKVKEFLNKNKDIDISHASEWLSQEEVDKIFSQYINES